MSDLAPHYNEKGYQDMALIDCVKRGAPRRKIDGRIAGKLKWPLLISCAVITIFLILNENNSSKLSKQSTCEIGEFSFDNQTDFLHITGTSNCKTGEITIRAYDADNNTLLGV